MKSRILVYGVDGFMGALASRAAMERGIAHVAAGRNIAGVAQHAAALAKEAGSAIANELGGDLGSIVSGVISGERPSGDSSDQASDTQAPEDEEESAEEEEDPADKAIRNALGSIFGPN